MASKTNPKVKIILDKERYLFFDLNAMVAFEEQTGINILNPAVQQQLALDMTPKQLRAFLWACLLHEDSELTLEQVGSWLHGGNADTITKSINEAVTAASPEAKGGKEKKVPLARNRPRG
uniref:Uncharacterized protein n=1 Tax=viral metagenome TaxID=1070528 RepID=A0A6M3JYZ1_9ZZZZ